MIRVILVLLSCAAFPLPALARDMQSMTTYWVAFLKRGPAWTPQATPETAKIQAGHMANSNAMAKTGKLILAGPFTDGGDIRGIFVFHVDSVDEAKKMAEDDPAVKSGRLVLEWHSWLSAKGIGITPTTPPPAKQPTQGDKQQ